MFLHVSVILFTGEVAVLSRMCYPRKGGVILSMGVLSLAAPPGWQTIAPPRMAEDGNIPYSQQVGSMHPTGILSCYCQQMKLQEGNVFTPACQSFCSQGGCIPAYNGSVIGHMTNQQYISSCISVDSQLVLR